MANANGDRNLLFGILALQMDFISRDALIRADGNDRRKESRAAWSKDNRQALERRLDGQDLSLLPSNTAFAVAATFLRQGSASRAEQVLRAVQEVHPNDCLVNLRLCAVLYQTPARREEALGFLRAAMAIKPDSPSTTPYSASCWTTGAAGRRRRGNCAAPSSSRKTTPGPTTT